MPVSEVYTQVAQAAQLIIAPDPENPYLQDAAHFADQSNEQAEFGPVSDEHRYMQSHILSILGRHAAEMANEPLAQHVFAVQPLAEKWQLYAHAREHAALAPTTLAAWQLDLESDDAMAAARDDPYTNAVAEAARTQVVMTEYQQIAGKKERKAHLAHISHRMSRFKAAIAHPSVGLDAQKQLIGNVNLAAARVGVWQHVEDDPFTDVNDKGMVQLIVKGLARELNQFDRRKYLTPNTPAQRIVHWLAARQKNPDVPALAMHEHAYEFTGKALIEAAAPEVASTLSFTSDSPATRLRLQLMQGSFEDANTTYEYILRAQRDSIKLLAALITAPFAMDMAATEPAHGIYGKGLRQSITATAALIGGETDRTIITQQLRDLRSELETIKDPAERIRCESAFIAATLRLDPDANVDIGQMALDKSWTALEQTASKPELLGTLRDDLAQDGIRLAPALKSHASGQFYIGFTPVITVAMAKGAKADRTWELSTDRENQVQHQRTAETLNALLEEQRYIVDTTAETPAMRGSWKTTLVFRTKEFHEAHAVLTRDGSLPIDQRLSDKIRTALYPAAR